MSTNPQASQLAVAMFEAFARNSGNSPSDHFDRNAAEQWMQQALDECLPKPAAAQESAPWRDHDAAIDAKALSTATEIALMWGQDRSQFISRIQVAVIDAMRWVKGGLQPAAAQEAVGVDAYDDALDQLWKLAGGNDHPVYKRFLDFRDSFAAPVTAAPAMESMGKRKLIQLQGDGFIVNGVAIYNPDTGKRGLVDYLGYVGWQGTPAAPGIDLAALRARVVSAIERITSGTGQMRVPADLTDPDLVLADVLTLLDALDPHCTDSPKGGSDAAAPAAITRMLPEVPESCERPEIGPHPFTGFDVGPFFVHLDLADNEAMTVSGTDDVGAWVVTHRESGFAVQKGIPTHWRAIWLAQQLLAKSSWSGATKGAVLATLSTSVVDEIRVLRADAMHGDCQGQIDTRWASSAQSQAGDAEVQP